VSNAALKPVEITAKVAGFTAGGKAKLGIRPQYLTPVDKGGMLDGRIALTERLGSETVVDLTLGDGTRLIAALARDAVFPIGANLGLTFEAAQAHIFPV
jgi:multiple sugar transport system ATP-binding protein